MSITPTRSKADSEERRTDGGTGRDDEPLAVAMLAAITEKQGETEEQPVQLYDHVDPEALEQLLAHAETREQSEWELTFTVEDVTVTVTSDGDVTVR